KATLPAAGGRSFAGTVCRMAGWRGLRGRFESRYPRRSAITLRDPMTRAWLPRLARTIRVAPLAIVTTAMLLLLAGAAPLQAQAPGTVFLEELTWTELRDLIAAGKTTILVPIGGTEQNGPQMVLCKHNFRAKALAAKIATQLGNALVAPEIAYVPE